MQCNHIVFPEPEAPRPEQNEASCLQKVCGFVCGMLSRFRQEQAWSARVAETPLALISLLRPRGRCPPRGCMRCVCAAHGRCAARGAQQTQATTGETPRCATQRQAARRARRRHRRTCRGRDRYIRPPSEAERVGHKATSGEAGHPKATCHTRCRATALGG